jgi:hypothetical protein
MSTHTPDRWVIVEMDTGTEKIHKVLGSWYGGYGGSDEWRFSSGIVKIVETMTSYLVANASGSVYTCYKNSEGMSTYTESIYLRLKESAEKDGMKLNIIDIKELSIVNGF